VLRPGRWRTPQNGEEGRHHIDESRVQHPVREAVRVAGLVKRATCHTDRHAGARHLREAGDDMSPGQEVLGHQDVRPTMIATRVLTCGGKGGRSPADTLWGLGSSGRVCRCADDAARKCHHKGTGAQRRDAGRNVAPPQVGVVLTGTAVLRSDLDSGNQ